MLILTLDYYIAKVEPYMFKHTRNKHEEEQEKEKKKKRKNIIIIYFINDKEEEKNERSVMRWSERADKKDERKQPKCVKRVGTVICTARTKNGVYATCAEVCRQYKGI